MKITYYVRATDTMGDIPFATYDEAFEFAKDCKQYYTRELVTINKRVWNDAGIIVEYTTVAVNKDNTCTKLCDYAKDRRLQNA